MDSNSNIINLSGLWVNESKSGRKYWSASVNRDALFAELRKANTEKVKLLLFPVKEQKEGGPVLSLCVAPVEQQATQGQPTTAPNPFDLP